MAGRNKASAALSPSQIKGLPIGSQVVDANMTIYTRMPGGYRWACETGGSIFTETLCQPPHTPVRIWKRVLTP